MARLARLVFPGYPHAVTQWGNYNQPVFEEDADYKKYLNWLKIYSDRYGMDIWAYCLMPNHVLYVCVPETKEALARTFNTVHMRYAQYFNGKRGLNGHLWRGRFLSCAMDEQSALEEIRYIETCPVREGLVNQAEEYSWSSARARLSDDAEPISEDFLDMQDGSDLKNKISDWKAFLEGRGEEAVVRRVRARLKTGRPSGNAAFMSTLEEVAGRSLRARPRGRPSKLKNPKSPGQ